MIADGNGSVPHKKLELDVLNAERDLRAHEARFDSIDAALLEIRGLAGAAAASAMQAKNATLIGAERLNSIDKKLALLVRARNKRPVRRAKGKKP